jgi:hypothetical protein
MKDKTKQMYVIVKHNVKDSTVVGQDEVVDLVRGETRAENAQERWNRHRSEADKKDGWLYVAEETDMRWGTDMKIANRLYKMKKAQRAASGRRIDFLY